MIACSVQKVALYLGSLFSFLFISSAVFAQTGNISGKVTDSARIALSNATVKIQRLDRQGFTKEMYNDDIKNNALYSTVAIPARSYFFTAAFKFQNTQPAILYKYRSLIWNGQASV